MEKSPESETKPRVRRRLIQSTLFPHKSQDNAVREDGDFEGDEDQEGEDEGYRGSQKQGKKGRKRKPKAASQLRVSSKLAVNGNETSCKNNDEGDAPVIGKVDFFVKVSERSHLKRKQKQQLPVHSPQENEQRCSSPDVVTNSKSPWKPRRRANSTPKKRQTNATPEKGQMNTTPAKNAVPGSIYEEYSEQTLASPPKPIPDLRLEAKMTAEENSRIFAGKQIHPFFSSWKTGKKNMETTVTENKWCHIERKDNNNDFSPVHIFEKTQGETFSLDWGNWTFSESSFMSTSKDPEDPCLQIYEGSVNCLQFDNFLDVAPLDVSLCQNKGSSSQYPIQLEELSLNYCSIPQEKFPTISSTFLADKQDHTNNQLRHVEVDYEMGKADGFSENIEFVEKSYTQWQGTFLSERCHPENSLWTTKYQPERAFEICGNCESVKILSEWLRLWHEKGSRTNKCSTDDNWLVQDVDLNNSLSDCDSEYSDEETNLKNVLLVTGPVGSGKSAAIYACAKEQGFQVIEVNTSDWRSGALVKQKFGEAVESHWLQCSTQNLKSQDEKNPSKSSQTKCNVSPVESSGNEVIELIPLSDGEDTKNVGGTTLKSVDKENKIACVKGGMKTLILFEDVDATLFEDRGFIATIQQLAETAKRPMILTSNSDDPDLPNNLDRIEVSFRIPSSQELLDLAYMVCAAEKARIEPCLVERFIDHCQGDIRKTIMLLQLWCQGQNKREDSEVRNRYAPLVFDTVAGHHVLPQMIPCGYSSKLCEIIEKEIAKSALMAEKYASLMEIIEEEEENNSNSRMDVKETHSIEARKDEMLRRHCSDQDLNDFSSQRITNTELPSCSSSPVAFPRKTSRRKNDAVMSSDSEECLNERSPSKTLDVNTGLVVEAKQIRRKYEAVPSSDSEECWHEGLCNKSIEVNAEVLVEANNLPSHSPADKKCFHTTSEQLLSEGEKLEENRHPFEGPCYSNINGMCKSGDISCVPESSFVPETLIENGTMLYSMMHSSGCVDGRIEEAPLSTEFVHRTMPMEFHNLDNCFDQENKGPAMLVRNFDLDTAPVQEEEVGDSHIEHTESLPREYQMMDECSRIDFSRKAESMHRPKSMASTDIVQETWRKLRNCAIDLRQHLSIEERNSLEVLELSHGMTNLISEADLLLTDCQSITCDYLKPSMVPTEKSHSFTWHDDQLQMASTIAQHGFCLYAKRSSAAGLSAKRVDLAWEMLTASSNAISLGKLVNQRKRMAQSLGNRMPHNGVSSKSALDSTLCDTVRSIVPLKSQLSLKGNVLHEYLSSLSQISRSESSRLSENTDKTNQRRKRIARNYLSNGALALSPEDISLLDQYSSYQKRLSRSKNES